MLLSTLFTFNVVLFHSHSCDAWINRDVMLFIAYIIRILPVLLSSGSTYPIYPLGLRT
jgi:hypothetical protein